MAHALHGDPGVTGSALAELASHASIEIAPREVDELAKSRAFLAPGRRIYVSRPQAHSWSETLEACRMIRDAGLEPVPHIPVRALADSATFEELLRDMTAQACVEEVLLIAGDAPLSGGPFSSVAQALRDPVFRHSGLRRVSFAGHPEGHPRVALETIRAAEREKADLATQLGLKATFITQFAFEAAPLIEWARAMRAAGVRARLVAGLAGPAKLSTLFKYAMRCGIGPSVRALGTNTTAAWDLVGDERSLAMMRAIAEGGAGTFDGVHFYGFGGFLRTAQWLHKVASGVPAESQAP